MRGNAHRQAHDTRIVDTDEARDDRPKDAPRHACHDYKHDRKRLQAADFVRICQRPSEVVASTGRGWSLISRGQIRPFEISTREIRLRGASLS